MMDNPFGDLIPQANAPRSMPPVSAPQAPAANNPFGDLIPGGQSSQITEQSSPQQADMPHSRLQLLRESAPAFVKGVGHGLHEAGQGLWQLGAEAASGLGLDKFNQDETYTKVTDAQNKAYEQALDPNHATAAHVGGFVGNTLPYLAAPQLGAEGLAARIGVNALTGAGIGAAQYVPEDGSRVANAALGGAIGGIIPGIQAAGSKAINVIKGGTESPAAQAIIAAGAQHNVPVFAADASQNPMLKGVTEGLENVPVLGTKGPRYEQMLKAQTAAENVTNNLKQQMLNTQFGSEGSIKGLQKLADAKDPIRGKVAQNLLDEVKTSGDDWQKIIENSGNLKSFQTKLIADQKYSQVASLANKFGGVDKDNTLKAIGNGIKGANDSVLPDQGLIKTLQTLGSNIGSKDLNYSQMREARSTVGNLISDYYTGKNSMIGGQGVGYLQGIKNAIDKDMNSFAQKNGPELKTAWQDADRYYQNAVVPYKDVQLAKALTNASPDEIYSKFITNGGVEGGKGTSRATRFYNALDQKGQAAVRYGMVNNALEKAINRDAGTFSPAIFASELDRVSAGKGVFFQGQAKAEIDGFKNLMRSVERSKIASSKPETGIKTIPWIIGAVGGFGAHAAGASGADLGLTAAGTLGLKKLLTTDAGRRLLLSSSKLQPGSPAMQKALDAAAKLTKTTAVVGATKPDKGGD
jgi:hypothetical protein